MKKIAIVLFVAATALAACGKKKAPASPAPTGDTSGSATPEAGSATGSDGSAGGSGG